jgi:hypothetical protein
MAGEVIQFVDTIASSPTVRLDLTSSPWSVIASGTDISPPSMSRAVVDTLLLDGAIIPASSYGNRVITLHLQLDVAPISDIGTAATQAQLLNRELDRPTNILKWQPHSTLPAVFFRTFRSPDYALVSDVGINLHEFTVQLQAEPFGYGIEELLSAITINNDPAAGSNGKFVDITSIKGDVETPLKISILSGSVAGRQSLFAMRRRGTPSAMPLFIQAEAMTQGTDTTTTANSATYSGAGSNSSTCTFGGTTTDAVRLSTATFPSSPSVDVRGTYRVFLRCTSNTSGAQFSIYLEHGARAILNTPNTMTMPTGGPLPMIDLGLVQLPEGYDPGVNGPSGSLLSVLGVPLKVHAARLTGSGNLQFDYLMFVPADDKLCIVSWGAASPFVFTLEGNTRSVYGTDASSRVADIQGASFVGDVPYVSPSITNRLVYINDVSPTNTSADGVTGNVQPTVSYWPRYLDIRPVST